MIIIKSKMKIDQTNQLKIIIADSIQCYLMDTPNITNIIAEYIPKKYVYRISLVSKFNHWDELRYRKYPFEYHIQIVSFIIADTQIDANQFWVETLYKMHKTNQSIFKYEIDHIIRNLKHIDTKQIRFQHIISVENVLLSYWCIDERYKIKEYLKMYYEDEIEDEDKPDYFFENQNLCSNKNLVCEYDTDIPDRFLSIFQYNVSF